MENEALVRISYNTIGAKVIYLYSRRTILGESRNEQQQHQVLDQSQFGKDISGKAEFHSGGSF